MRPIMRSRIKVIKHLVGMELASTSAEHGVQLAERFGVVLNHVDFEDQRAVVRLTNVTLSFKTFTAFLVLSEHHPLAVEIERATPEGVNCSADVEHCDTPIHIP